MPTQRPWPEASAPSRPPTSRASKGGTPSAGSRSPTTTSTSESIDVALETDDHAIACEITIETPGAKELRNIQKAIDAGFDRIILICPNPRKRKGLTAAIETHFARSSVPVVCIPPSELENQLRQTQPETAHEIATESAPPPAANKKPRGYAVEREFADGTQHQPLSESKAMEILAKIMRPQKDEQN